MFNVVLRQLREKYNISQLALSKELFVSQQSIAKWENDKATPNPEMIVKISEFFNVSTDYLLGNAEKTIRKGVKIPVLGRVQAGIPMEAIEDILDYEEIDEELASTGEFFALQIRGSSMEPRMLEGDVVIVKKQSTVNSGEIAIVLVNGDEATCKKVIIHENGISLISFNQVFNPKFFTTEEIIDKPITIIGKVVELRGKF